MPDDGKVAADALEEQYVWAGELLALSPAEAERHYRRTREERMAFQATLGEHATRRADCGPA